MSAGLFFKPLGKLPSSNGSPCLYLWGTCHPPPGGGQPTYTCSSWGPMCYCVLRVFSASPSYLVEQLIHLNHTRANFFYFRLLKSPHYKAKLEKYHLDW